MEYVDNRLPGVVMRTAKRDASNAVDVLPAAAAMASRDRDEVGLFGVAAPLATAKIAHSLAEAPSRLPVIAGDVQ